MTSAGFPHSDISGSTPACDSPELFAANHVLHRLLTPRHSSCALSSLTTNLSLPLELNLVDGNATKISRHAVRARVPYWRLEPSPLAREQRSRSKLHEGAPTR